MALQENIFPNPLARLGYEKKLSPILKKIEQYFPKKNTYFLPSPLPIQNHDSEKHFPKPSLGYKKN